MRPADLSRELERLTIAAATSRAQLADMRGRLKEASSIVFELKSALLGRAQVTVDADTTPRR